ncbi:hypothetical protein [Polymorphobacter fuscus]|uniref:Uncharacterized protein n=1 Tax=Sandarakinorhabdus fusca TaxID=1439888 RepID=A0A7C9GYJ4_9SPHN|nr:hypothetical protein [Polymorphobacter fuscus]KAB7645550.1 hypothetical protein F9290_12075 [Polymorphobacter fuscus]MQT17994.1 hypothetical protein [Polymorphobacter fuscus]NJC08622.1 hypothetical protein [Polymorphobacter fuscus]
MSAGLSTDDAARVGKLLAHRDSVCGPERAAAEGRIEAIAGRYGLTAGQAVAAVRRPMLSAGWRSLPVALEPNWKRKVTLCRDCIDLFTSRERDFIRSIDSQRAAPSERQASWLDALHRRALKAVQP